MKPLPSVAAPLLLAALLAGAAFAQHSPPAGHHSPYAHQGDSGISGLSPTELEQLREGRGMGLARPAELNSYPGPLHVLELAAELGLDAARVTAVQRAFDEMQAEAVRLGAAIIELESQLDRRFRHRHIDADTLAGLTAEIGRLQGELRAVHLRAHLEVAALLSADEIAAYDRLRGYAK